SLTFMQVSSITGNTAIVGNGTNATDPTQQNGILLQFMGGHHDILIEGQGSSGTQFGTFIQGNNGDGIHSEAGDETSPINSSNANAGIFLTVNNVLIGGPTAVESNKGSGINFQAQAVMTTDPDFNNNQPFTWDTTNAGYGTLTVLNSVI